MKPVPFKGTAKYIVYGVVKVFRYDIMHEIYTHVTGKYKSIDVAVHHMTEGAIARAALILKLSSESISHPS